MGDGQDSGLSPERALGVGLERGAVAFMPCVLHLMRIDNGGLGQGQGRSPAPLQASVGPLIEPQARLRQRRSTQRMRQRDGSAWLPLKTLPTHRAGLANRRREPHFASVMIREGLAEFLWGRASSGPKRSCAA